VEDANGYLLNSDIFSLALWEIEALYAIFGFLILFGAVFMFFLKSNSI